MKALAQEASNPLTASRRSHQAEEMIEASKLSIAELVEPRTVRMGDHNAFHYRLPRRET